MGHLDVLKVVKHIATLFGLNYLRPGREESNHWYGTAAPLFSFILIFKTRLNEFRVGHSVFTVSKDFQTNMIISVSQYGLNNVHHPLLEGITVAPERKSGIAQSLGPLIIKQLLLLSVWPDLIVMLNTVDVGGRQ